MEETVSKTKDFISNPRAKLKAVSIPLLVEGPQRAEVPARLQ